ncbi:MAG: arylesterase [Verrucomicrobiales bacterium]|nr:arylesterase [Verrucomicrobiales bacterium]
MTYLKTSIFALFFCMTALSGGAEERRILVLGDSLTKGYGLDPEDAYPSLLQEKIKESGLDDWTVMNGGVSGDTTAGGLRRINWLLRKEVDILIVALGGNDGLRGIDPSETEKNLQGIIDAARKKCPDLKIIIAGMQMPDNLGKDYVKRFREAFPKVAEENDLPMIPFLLEGVGGNPDLNQPDFVHPNEAGQKIIAETVWKVLGPIVGES